MSGHQPGMPLHLLFQSQFLQAGATTRIESNPLDSIAKVAVDAASKVALEKISKRRSQIAAASRKSRAKRKRELTDLRDENNGLRAEVSQLKKRLRELGEDVVIDGGETDTQSCGGGSTSEETEIETKEAAVFEKESKLEAEEQPQLKQIVTFLNERMAWFFQTIKNDAITYNEADEDTKKLVKQLQVKVVLDQ
mmetsp:Transcript_6155/g.9631  ORF Transcript_6155/g.9631 Transcript_6155/m.9631 type:complete len:194 (-) Transcript_6155:1199-1780(-)|eukprot:CAMPEP_0203747880 /NCGR_PEP_ID=MMETSP0098-20131031/2884_1 /ASSEMBLY_ACC=CAM_ASM_000208 /TAXON_ID=96639 /ORGANISM=" , Strain NY0313808BC1" /LENGTH=193 /DNA_ID=CAMNT_0050636447 /DNA_START=324 /DNA_END=905 /DNA_ORIENTATION=-